MVGCGAQTARSPGAIEVEDPLDAQDGLTGDRILAGDRDLPGLASAMAPAPDLVPLVEIGFAVVERRPLGGRLEEQVVEALGVGLDIPLKPRKSSPIAAEVSRGMYSKKT